MFNAIYRIRKGVIQAAHMLVGIPDYEHYLQHMRFKHPELPVMSYEDFFRERQQARYAGKGKGGMRCC